MSSLYFFLTNLATFSLLIDVTITVVLFFIAFTRAGVTPLDGVTLHLFYLSDLVSPLFFVNLPTIFFPSGVTLPKGVTRGGPPLPSDATGGPQPYEIRPR